MDEIHRHIQKHKVDGPIPLPTGRFILESPILLDLRKTPNLRFRGRNTILQVPVGGTGAKVMNYKSLKGLVFNELIGLEGERGALFWGVTFASLEPPEVLKKYPGCFCAIRIIDSSKVYLYTWVDPTDPPHSFYDNVFSSI